MNPSIDFTPAAQYPSLSELRTLSTEVERAWARARRPRPNIRFAVNQPWARGAWFFKKLAVGLSLNFTVLKKEKLGLEAGLMVLRYYTEARNR